MQTIMVATDFSERSDRALRRATLLAKETGASLILVHVVDDDRPRHIVDREGKDAESLLRELAATVRRVDGVACDTRVMLADPFAGIIESTADASPDLLVIGPHRRLLLRDAFIGTTAERTIRSVACPVLMANTLPIGPYRHVLRTTDLSEGSRDALNRFEKLRIGPHARNSLLHVFDAPALRLAVVSAMPEEEQEAYLQTEQATAATALTEFAASIGIGVAERILRHDKSTAAMEIMEVAEEVNADLIVLSTHGRAGLAKFFLGSVAEDVLRSANTDVLAIPPKQAV